MLNREFIEEFINVKKSGKSYHIFRNVFKNVPDYQIFIDYKDWSKEHGQYRSDRPGFYILHTTSMEELDHMGDYRSFVDSVHEVYETLNDLDNFGVTVVISEHSRDTAGNDLITGIPKHTDQTDTVHWAAGHSVWKVSDGEEEFEFELNSGDVFYGAKDLIHEVESVTPRAGIVISAGEWSKNFDPNKRY